MASEEPERRREIDLETVGIRGSSAPATIATQANEVNHYHIAFKPALDNFHALSPAENRASSIEESTDTMTTHTGTTQQSATSQWTTPPSENLPTAPLSQETLFSPNINEKSSLQQPAPMPTIKFNPDSSEAALMDVKTEPVEGINRPSQDLMREVSLKNLRAAVDSGDLAILEASVAAATAILDLLRGPMKDFKHHGDLRIWLQKMDELKARAKKSKRTVVAVAGATGAGKSSLINALLDEEKLLPTNGMRACTAVVTEICYNLDLNIPYRAEVEFISHEEWSSEIALLFDEFLTNGHLSQAWKDPNSDAGVAYAKVRAVYPELTHEMLVKSDPKQLAKAEAVAKVLGTQQDFGCARASELHSVLVKYLDSNEKGAKVKTIAFWPIVRVVRIFTRADALSTNVCLVDLPGTLDSNAARSAVANKYMAECTAVWVAARIARAADDKAAKDLLGRSSRIQMKLDGAYDYLSFIATQTDGIDIRETIDSLDEDGKIRDTFSQEDDLSAAIAEKNTEVHSLEKQKNDLNDDYDAVAQEQDTWTRLEKKQKKGQKVYKPAAPSTRTRGTKRRRTVRQPMDDESDSDEVPLTAKEIAAKLGELQEVINNKGDECDEAEKQCEAAKKELFEMKMKKEDIAVERTRLCVQKRNSYCQDAIRQDFAAGIREIDEEDDQADEEKFDPSVQKRDYEEVARSLPVFCISSKAYQQLRKTNKRGETQVEGFKTLEDTQIPSLQEHAKAASHKGRIRSSKVVLNQFSQLLNSLILWTSDTKDLHLSSHASQTNQDVSEYDIKFIDFQTGELKKKFVEAVFSLKTELLGITRETFDKSAKNAVAHASKSIGTTVGLWNQSVKDGGYGLTFQTYRATCRRSGEKTRNIKSRNFNEDLLEPYLVKIASSWEHAFLRSIPAALSKFIVVIMLEVRAFHTVLVSRAELHKGRTASLRLLGDQLEHHEATITEGVNRVKGQLQTGQREASRLFLPEIKDAMMKIYTKCAEEKGVGCFQRMKDNMNLFTQKNKGSMYRKVGAKVQKQLEKAIQTAVTELLEECEHVRNLLASDYKLILTSSEAIEVNALVREAIRDVLYQTDDKFETILQAAQQAMDVDSAAETQQTTSEPQPSESVAAGPDVQGEKNAASSSHAGMPTAGDY